MELMKIVLMMFVWPAGHAENSPMWTNQAFFTFAECEAQAIEKKAAMQKTHGPNARIEHYCISVEDRLAK